MNLKRIVAAVLAIIMLLALAACGENGQSGGDSSSEVISESQALSTARSYIETPPGKQLFVVWAMPSGAKSMSNIDAGSASCIGQNDGGSYEILVKGNFFANDEYGNLYGHYTFECVVTVNSNGYADLDVTSVTVRKA
jgi:hypothetical protein